MDFSLAKRETFRFNFFILTPACCKTVTEGLGCIFAYYSVIPAQAGIQTILFFSLKPLGFSDHLS
jgi:hypothetical protein